MKKLAVVLLSTVIGSGASNSAIAQSKFDGFYAGPQAGFVESKDDGSNEDSNPFSSTFTYSTNPSSQVLGLFFGYSKVFDNKFLVGFEADFESRGKRDIDSTTFYSLNAAKSKYEVVSKLGNAGSLRLRLGQVFNNDLTSAYITAGYATANIKRNYNYYDLIDIRNDTTASRSAWLTGWTFGAGFEHLMSDGIFFKAEYRLSDYGSDETSLPVNTGWSDAPFTAKTKDVHSLRFGVGFKF